MLGAGTFVSALLRVATTVAILAAIYFFIVRPVLDTTEKVSHSFATSPAVRSAESAVRQAGVHPAQLRRKIRVSVRRTTRRVKVRGIPRDARRVLACIQRANGDVEAIQACNH